MADAEECEVAGQRTEAASPEAKRGIINGTHDEGNAHRLDFTEETKGENLLEEQGDLGRPKAEASPEAKRGIMNGKLDEGNAHRFVFTEERKGESLAEEHGDLGRPTAAKAASEWEDSSKILDVGIHSLTQSVAGEVSRPLSEVDVDDALLDQATEGASAENIHESGSEEISRGPQEVEGDEGDGEIELERGHLRLQSHEPDSEELRRRISSPHCRLGEAEEDEDIGEEISRGPQEVEGDKGDGEIELERGHLRPQAHEPDSEELRRRISSSNDTLREAEEDGDLSQPSELQSHEPASEELRRRISSPNETVRDAEEDEDLSQPSELQFQEPESEELRRRISSPNDRLREAEEDEDLSQPSELQDEQASQQISDSGSSYHAQRSDSGEFGRPTSALEKTDSYDTEVDAVSYLATLPSKTRAEDEFAQQWKLDEETSVFYPPQFDDPGEIIDPFQSLEDRIRKAREDQDLALEWEVENLVDARLLSAVDSVGASQLSYSEEASSSILNLEEISPDQQTHSSARVFERPGLSSSELKERRRTEAPSEELGDEKQPARKITGAGEAVLLGALASGVNRPTWFFIKAVLVALVASLVLLLHVAIQSTSWFILLNVLFLIAIAGGLIFLLSWYVSEIGLVSVEKQMAELNLANEQSNVESKTL